MGGLRWGQWGAVTSFRECRVQPLVFRGWSQPGCGCWEQGSWPPPMETRVRGCLKPPGSAPRASARLPPNHTHHHQLCFACVQAAGSGNPRKHPLLPVSIASSLALLSLGAQADTSTQILQGLGFNLTETPQASIHRGFQSLIQALDLPSPKLELKVGHSLFLDKQLKPRQRFLDDIRELYGAFAFSVNLTDSATACRQMNDYVRKQTYGQVVDCLQEFSEDTPMVLLNYIFFKAKWKHPFHRYQTQKQESFFVNERPSLHVPMMHQKEMHRFLYDQERACTVLQVEHSGNALALLILPDPGRMQQVEAALQPETLQTWSQLLLPSRLDLHLPRFAISGAYNLGEILPHIGLGNIFNLGADLLGVPGRLNGTIFQFNPNFRLPPLHMGVWTSYWPQELECLLDLHLPRFAISGTYNLEEILPHIGLGNVFNLGADLLGVPGRLNGTIFRVSHKAAMDMSERGTKAGAASGLLSQPRPLNVTWAPHARFNRPFLVLVWEVATQSLLLLGKVANPAAG
ncbi:hypothetical protein QTO34_020183 [Cnephaeus nilssonii]|uniref:Serpin domain-containing protein n=1 Tax=Cnephaeus nilssonii TaxID=3371016 RepID=A0AA40HYU6_CNENI|nr:hypothetical protein QTO34_020183 [Eptesicus nilssonii]